MAPVKISYVVSFSSQDPKYPVENLLLEDGLRPWLGCPQDRSRQLRVELQLERASPIGYVDIGNCGCAFLQIEVGRSSWPLDRPYLTLVPSVTLMTPDDSKLDQNRCGVRMFKEADFLEPAVGQKWDRLRLTCSQPFSKHGQFGLSFIRVRTPLDPEHPQPPPPSQQGLVSTSHASMEEEQLKTRLQQLEPSAWSPARLSRPARMVLSAAQSRALRPRAGTGAPRGDPELLAEEPGGPAVPGEPELPVASVGHIAVQRAFMDLVRAPQNRPKGSSGTLPSHGLPEPCAHPNTREPGTTVSPPLSAGRFSLDLLPAHASRCGEEDLDAAWPSSPLAEASPDAWVFCPICKLPFGAAEVEWHASTCGEQPGTLDAPSSS
ncbi:XRCC1 protein, partial [Chunga burmeisteri]|nr:XRCC1 protein [Chunga burmeisteri]